VTFHMASPLKFWILGSSTKMTLLEKERQTLQPGVRGKLTVTPCKAQPTPKKTLHKYLEGLGYNEVI